MVNAVLGAFARGVLPFVADNKNKGTQGKVSGKCIAHTRSLQDAAVLRLFEFLHSAGG